MKTLFFIFATYFFSLPIYSQQKFDKDIIETSNGKLEITFIGHGTLYFEFESYIIHVDPVSRYADYTKLPKADLILVTHHHGDHLDSAVIETLWKSNTELVLTETCFEKMQKGTVMKNGDEKAFHSIPVSAVPAYNLVHKRKNGQPYHPKGTGNGYILGFGDKSVYIAGDTEDFPEMAEIGEVDIAFLPMNVPYTMTPEMVAHAVELFHPKILYPYHFGNTDTNELLELLKDRDDIEIRIREMQ